MARRPSAARAVFIGDRRQASRGRASSGARRWGTLAVAGVLACTPPPQREIVFAAASGPIADSATVVDVFAMRPDGSGLRQLTHGAGVRRESNGPVWSPDGKQIAYGVFPRSYPAERGSVHVMDASGANDRLLIELDSLDTAYVEWSPDGRRLSFTGFTIDTTQIFESWIYVIDADGSGITRLSHSAIRSQSASPVACASWLPDGNALLVSEAGSPGPSRILRMDVPSGETRVLVESDTLALLCPVPAPDAPVVLLTAWPRRRPRSKEGGGMNIYRMNLDGGDLRPFVVMKGFAKNARWSHDGRSVVFHGSDLPDFYELSPAARGDSIAIFTTDRYGGNLKRVSQSPYGAVHPGW